MMGNNFDEYLDAVIGSDQPEHEKCFARLVSTGVMNAIEEFMESEARRPQTPAEAAANLHIAFARMHATLASSMLAQSTKPDAAEEAIARTANLTKHLMLMNYHAIKKMGK